MVKHKHHIIPKHMGGSDDPSNLVELTVEEHAEAHRILFEKYGNWQDKIAWQGLSKMINKIEIISKAQSNALKEYRSRDDVKQKYAEINRKLWSNPEHRKNISEHTKKQWENPDFIKIHKDKMEDFNKMIWSNPVIREKITTSNRRNNRRVVSLDDGKVTTWSNRIKHERKTGYKHNWSDI